MTYHIFHVWGWGENFPSDFIMVIKYRKHIVLGNRTFPSGLGQVCGLAEIFWRRRANISEIGCWKRWRGSGTEGCQCTCSTGYTQEQNVNSHAVFIHDWWLGCAERFLFLLHNLHVKHKWFPFIKECNKLYYVIWPFLYHRANTINTFLSLLHLCFHFFFQNILYKFMSFQNYISN